MSLANIILNRINVVIYLKSIFFSEKFAHTDIEISENIKTIRDFKLGCSKAFCNRLLRILKGNYSTKENPKELLIIAGKSGKILPAVSSEKNAFSQSSLDSKLESWQTISFIFEETDIASFLNAFVKSAETEMHHYLSLCLLLSLMQM